ncbi:MAG: PDZ domain-containing protein [Planctomycetota bacterium]|nr:MAG: PDZ domain-containing protein [Planctomycetota bacterium]
MIKSTTTISCFALVVLLAGTTASAQRDDLPDTRPPVEEMVEWLDSPVFAARQQALVALLERRDLDLVEIDAWRSREDLSPEQRLRLDELALQVFARGPRAALGISFPPDDRGGVRIMDVVAGFAAADLLVPGDRILTADGVPLSRQAMLRAAILSHAPGEHLELTVERGGEILDISVPLGSFGNLRGAATPRASDLVAAWSLRQSRAGSRRCWGRRSGRSRSSLAARRAGATRRSRGRPRGCRCTPRAMRRAGCWWAGSRGRRRISR